MSLEKLSLGKLEWSVRFEVPTEANVILILAHGAGAGMDHPFMQLLAAEFLRAGVGVVRFNFPYMEQGKFRPDTLPVTQTVITEVVERTALRFPHATLIGSGKSFGGRMFSHFALQSRRLSALIFFGFPLHPEGKPGIARAVHLKDVQIPMLFLQGSKDALATPALLAEVTSPIPAATVVNFEGATHGFNKGKSFLTTELAEAALEWLRAKGLIRE